MIYFQIFTTFGYKSLKISELQRSGDLNYYCFDKIEVSKTGRYNNYPK